MEMVEIEKTEVKIEVEEKPTAVAEPVTVIEKTEELKPATKKTKAADKPAKVKKIPKVFWTFGVRVPIEVKQRLATLSKTEYKELTKKIKQVLSGEINL